MMMGCILGVGLGFPLVFGFLMLLFLGYHMLLDPLFFLLFFSLAVTQFLPSISSAIVLFSLGHCTRHQRVCEPVALNANTPFFLYRSLTASVICVKP
jgi:hypothetical protein